MKTAVRATGWANIIMITLVPLLAMPVCIHKRTGLLKFTYELCLRGALCIVTQELLKFLMVNGINNNYKRHKAQFIHNTERLGEALCIVKQE